MHNSSPSAHQSMHTNQSSSEKHSATHSIIAEQASPKPKPHPGPIPGDRRAVVDPEELANSVHAFLQQPVTSLVEEVQVLQAAHELLSGALHE
ncbi:hypothetical protein [Corynebacterium sp. HS2168-gen11]|uniref:hypothetical protein n=1 Tax=Corynebacterium sp. HS2168-gen11 TaxID=2974027 RepID=UPI00216ACBDB|nr:hypothetical protein [Corynebacterium sp. HS2168-gen11]MCS4535024.1 hypothetical protein [Corynebacterium sp. HS2168-gen11]